MREAIGSSSLLTIIILIVGVVLLLLVGALSYSKAFKVKNRIINIINNEEKYDKDVKEQVEIDLASIGYTVQTPKCDANSINNTQLKTNYDFCIYQIKTKNNEMYYRVVTYTNFEIPLIGKVLHIPVKGETKVFNKNYEY